MGHLRSPCVCWSVSYLMNRFNLPKSNFYKCCICAKWAFLSQLTKSPWKIFFDSRKSSAEQIWAAIFRIVSLLSRSSWCCLMYLSSEPKERCLYSQHSLQLAHIWQYLVKKTFRLTIGHQLSNNEQRTFLSADPKEFQQILMTELPTSRNAIWLFHHVCDNVTQRTVSLKETHPFYLLLLQKQFKK